MLSYRITQLSRICIEGGVPEITYRKARWIFPAKLVLALRYLRHVVRCFKDVFPLTLHFHCAEAKLRHFPRWVGLVRTSSGVEKAFGKTKCGGNDCCSCILFKVLSPKPYSHLTPTRLPHISADTKPSTEVAPCSFNNATLGLTSLLPPSNI